MARDRRANIGTALTHPHLARERVEELRATGHLPHYHDRFGEFVRPHVQWSKRSNWSRRRDVFTRDDFTCQHCGYRPASIPDPYDGSVTVGDLVIDHVTSLRDGGHHLDPDNLQTLCKRCNGRKC